MIKLLKKWYYTYKAREAEADFKERGEMGYWGAFPEKQDAALDEIVRLKQLAGISPPWLPTSDERAAAGYEPKS